MVLRFIDREARDLFTTDRVSRQRAVQEWWFDRGRLPAGCTLVAGGVESYGSEGALLQVSPREVTLQFEVDLNSEEIDLVRVRHAGLLRGGAVLSWRSEQGSWSDSARIALDRQSLLVADDNELRFEVVQSDRWTGRVAELRLRLNTKVGDLVVLESVTAETRSTDSERLREALDRPWKIEIENEWRNALMAHPGHPIERALVVPEDGSLRLAFGRMTGMRDRVRYIAEVITGQETVTVLDRELPDPHSESMSPWYQEIADLTPWAGQEIRLRLSVETDVVLDASQGLPVWGHPEVWGRVERRPLPNLVLVSIDTLRAANLSLYGYDRSTSPRLDRWAREGVVFRNAVAQAPWTLPSHISIFSGLNSFRHGVNFNDSPPLTRDVPVLAEVLRGSGYATSAITAGGFVHPRFSFARGFDSYLFWPASQNRTDELESLVQRAIQRLSDSSESAPFFLFFHTLEVHPPNEARQPYFSEFSSLDPELRSLTDVIRPKKEMGFLGKHRGVLVSGTEFLPLPPELAQLPTDLYDSAIAYTDFQLDRLLQALDDLELSGETMVVITSDHGEALGEQERWGHGHLYESNLLVPLIIRFPDRRQAGKVVESQVRLVDLLPTILDTLGLPSPKAIDGQSLLPLIDGHQDDHPKEAWSYAPSTNEGLVLRWGNRLRYVFRDAAWPPVGGSEMLYDLREDADATVDLALDQPDEVESLRARSIETLENQAQGLRIRFSNEGASVIQGLLESLIIGPVTVKTVAASPVPIQWRGMGRLSFELGSRSDYTLIFTKIKDPSIDLAGELEMEGCPTPATFDLSLNLDELTGPQKVDFDAERCEVIQPLAGRSKTGLTFWWVGSQPEEWSGSGLDDPDLRKQLEALGYLD